MSKTSLERDLKQIEARIADVDLPPATTLDIIGEATRERYWEDLLVYFLTPELPHGYETDVLAAFLDALADHDETSLSSVRGDLEQVEVRSQVSTGAGTFDILLWAPDDWYVVVELKVDAPETNSQTSRYAQATQLGDLNVSDHDGLSEYVYLAPARARPSDSETFVDVSWRHIVPYLEDVLRSSYGQYPLKSHAQLADYLDTIRRTFNMDDLTSISEETKLYTEYSDTIDRLVSAYESDKATLFAHIEEVFLAEVEDKSVAWSVNNRPSGYINFAKRTWDDAPDGVTIEYEPHIHLDRDSPNIRLRLDIEGSGKRSVRKEFRDRLDEDAIADLDEAGWEIVDGSYAYIAKSVPLDLDRPDNSIRNAVRELHKLRQIVEPAIDDLVADYQRADS